MGRSTDVMRATTEKETIPSMHTIDPNGSDDGTPFFIDSIGERAPQTGMPDPITNIASEESSEDEIVFHGRQKWNEPSTRLLEDHPEMPTKVHSLVQGEKQGAGEWPVAVPFKMPPNDTESASGSSRPALHAEIDPTNDGLEDLDAEDQQPERHYAENIIDGEFDVFTDYILNIDDDYYQKNTARLQERKSGATSETQSPLGLQTAEQCKFH